MSVERAPHVEFAVREKMSDCGQDYRIRVDAMAALQEASEAFLTGCVERAAARRRLIGARAACSKTRCCAAFTRAA